MILTLCVNDILRRCRKVIFKGACFKARFELTKASLL